MSTAYPIKAIYDSAGTMVTGLGEFSGSDQISLDIIPTGTANTQVALGGHTHDSVYSKRPASSTAGNLAVYTDTTGGLKDSSITMDSVVTGTTSSTVDNLMVFTDASGNAKDSSFNLKYVTKGPDSTTNQTTDGLAVFSGTTNTIKKTTATSGLIKVDGNGAVSTATAGTDYVSKDNSTTFTKPQIPSSISQTAIASSTVTWDLNSHQTLRLTLPNSGSATLTLSNLSASVQGVSYRLIIKQPNTATLTFPSASIKFQSAFAYSTTASKVDMYTFEVYSPDGTNYYLYEIGRAIGLAV